MEAKELIADHLLRIVREITKEETEVQISVPEKSENGDYYTNVALRLPRQGGVAQGKPLDIAYKIKSELEKVSELVSVVEKVEVATPGFVNFFLSEQYLRETVDYIKKKGDRFGSSEKLEGQKVMIEFTDPNPFKEFHIGHLYSNIVGESLSRLYESQGAQVLRACYQGDVGLHVAKAIYSMQKLSGQMPDEKAPLSVRAQFMGRAYVLGSADYESSKNAKKEIDDLNRKIYKEDKSVRNLYKRGREWSLEYFDSIYKRLGTKFVRFYFESEVGKIGADTVGEFLKKKVFVESEGAIIFPGKKYGLHNRVFINSQGIPTYEAKELGLAPTKYKDFPYDVSLIVTGHEVDEYFKVVLKALELINPELASKTIHVSHGMVRMPGGKISSRTGEILTGEWLMDETVSGIRRAYQDMDEETSEKVGLAAIKFALLQGTIGRDIEFSFEESVSLTGASGPYLQYTYVRTRSVLEKSQQSTTRSKKQITLNLEELAVLRSLVHFEETVEEAQAKLAPNLVAKYLFDLASKFNLFYQKHKIAGNQFRLELTTAVGQVLKTGLKILGIETVGKM